MRWSSSAPRWGEADRRGPPQKKKKKKKKTHQIISYRTSGTGGRGVTIFKKKEKSDKSIVMCSFHVLRKRTIIYSFITPQLGMQMAIPSPQKNIKKKKKKNSYLPAQISKFLVNSLKSHFELCVLCYEYRRRW